MSDSLYTVIGDLVGSRHVSDRRAVQTALARALNELNKAISPAQALEPTVGDEFQGGFATLASATRASLLVRLSMLPTVDSRSGIGYGEVTVHDDTRTPLLQDGPGWCAAREAVESLEAGRPHRRTSFVASDRPDGPHDVGAVNAYLVCR
ncbi:MAG: SatD family protein, partial [Nocardioides sp.]